jgi:hypothetical protein
MNRTSDLRRTVLAAMMLPALLGGCTTMAPPVARPTGEDATRTQACTEWIERLDAAIDAAGVRDGQAHRIGGLPTLRVDRFSAALQDRSGASEEAFVAWIARLRALDAEARNHELANAPVQALTALGVADRRAAVERTGACADLLTQAVVNDPVVRASLADRARVPDDYSTLKRALGLYGITSVPFSWGVEAWHRNATQMFRAAGTVGPSADSVRHAPAAAPATAAQITGIHRRVRRDALGVPHFAPGDEERLFEAYAPVFEIERTGPWDATGRLVWQQDRTPVVDPSQPTVYRRLAFTRLRGEVLAQLVYTLWFPERPADSAVDLLAGKLDGVVVRVTLDARGAPLIYDTIHPCGCWHLFLPTPRLRTKAAPGPRIEWAFSPATLPELQAGQRMVVRIASRSHFVIDVRPDSGAAGVAYTLTQEDKLRALERPDGTTRSIYAPDGLVRGTERPERFLFWPMGIDSAGAMRQWGRHATAFLGRRHFDDADLFDLRFEPVDTGNTTAP